MSWRVEKEFRKVRTRRHFQGGESRVWDIGVTLRFCCSSKSPVFIF